MNASEASRRAGWAIPWVTTAARLILGGVLIVAGGLKIGNPSESVVAVRAYELLPDAVATTVGYGLPIVEIVVGLLLIIGLMTRVAAVVAALLMLAFVFGIAWAWGNGLRIDCGCFGGGGQLGAGQEPTYLVDILRDFGFVLLGAWIVRFPPGRYALDRPLGLAGVDHPIGEEENGDGQGRPGEVGA